MVATRFRRMTVAGSDEPPRYRLQLSPGAVVATVVATSLLLVGLVVADVEVAIVRGVLAFGYLSFVPGYLLLRLAGVRCHDLAEFAVYVVVVGLVFLMAYGAVVSLALRSVGVAEPIAAVPLTVAIAVAVLVMTAAYHWRVDAPATIEVQRRHVRSPWLLGLTLLPFLAVYGALLLHRYGSNALLLVLYAAIAAVPLLIRYDVVPQRYVPFAIWVVAVSLLLQNTLTGEFLAWGDQPTEARTVVQVIETGFWSPALQPAGVHGNQYTMLRLTILHPIYVLVGGLELVWSFKLVHPLLFSMLPVALYGAYDNVVDTDVAVLAVYLYVSLFAFFVVLSRNTRTGTALLFVGTFLLLLTDSTLRPLVRRGLMLMVLAGVVVSHYGVSYIFLLALGMCFLLVAAVKILRWSGLVGTVGANELQTTNTLVATVAMLTFSWYLFASPRGVAFRTLVLTVDDFVIDTVSQYLQGSAQNSATVHYTTSQWSSVTLEILKLYNVVLGLLVGVGILLAWVKLLDNRKSLVEPEFLIYASVFLGVFGLTFLPVARFNTARTFASTLLFFAPFYVFGTRALLTAAGTAVGRLRPAWRERIDRRATINVAITLAVAYFLLNSGFLAATVTQEYSPNVLVEKERVVDDGAPPEVEYFYQQYPTEQGVRASAWLRVNAAPNSTVYQSGWPGGLQWPTGYPEWGSEIRKRSVPLTTARIAPQRDAPGGYVYLGPYAHRSNVLTVETPGVGGFTAELVRADEVDSKWEDRDRIYDNGDAVVYR